MKKTALICLFFTFISMNLQFVSGSDFSQALKTCAPYSKTGNIDHGGETFNILITLEKNKNDKCIYKEKISQDSNYQLLTCTFEQSQLSFMSASMEKFSAIFKEQISKNDIFEAKMTTNGEIFQKYLANPHYCQISQSKQ